MMRRGLAGLVLAVVTTVTVPSWAQETEASTPVTADAAKEALTTAATELEAALDQTAFDCSAACMALASMQRAAERLCELEPGPRCDTARERVEAARRRVADQCPACDASRQAGAIGPTPSPSPSPSVDDSLRSVEDADDGEKDAEVQQSGKAVTVTTQGAAPPSESDRGGCAACRVGGSEDPRGPWALLLAALALGIRRRRA